MNTNDAPERIELLPCPFCGGTSFRKALNKKNYCQLHGEPSQSFRIACANSRCAAQPSVSAGDAEQRGGQAQALRDAEKAWNTRAMQTQVSESDLVVPPDTPHELKSAIAQNSAALAQHKQAIAELVAALHLVEQYLWDDEWEGNSTITSAVTRAKALEVA